MDFAPSFYKESSALIINIMIVDDDPVFLRIMSRQIEKSKYRDPSVMEIRVITEKGPEEALSTLQVQRNNIDLIITDYHMPVMNGLELKNQITQDFGNLPILVMSVDKEKEQESLTSGALGFFPKPIKPTDLPTIFEFALTYKRNGRSTQLDHQVTNVSIPRQINLLPDPQVNVVKTKKRDSDSRKNQKGNPNVGPSDDGKTQLLPSKKAKVMWSESLHDKFLQAIEHIGHDKVVAKKILEFMNEPHLTRENVASHLQKYRIRLRKKVVEPCSKHFAPSPLNDRSLNDGNFYTNSEYGLLQSRPTPEQMPYMNRSSNYDLHSIGSGSNFMLPIQSNHFLPDQPFDNVERRSFSEPFVMDNEMDQASQVFRSGLLGPTDVTGNNFNNDMMSGNGSFASNQPGSSLFSYDIQSYLNNENTACNPQPNLEHPPLERRSFSEPFVMDNKIHQTSQGFGFGLLGPTGNNFNNDMMSSYKSFASNQPGSSHFSYENESFLDNENTACNPQPNLELPPSCHLTPPTSCLDANLSDRSFNTKFGYGLGQSRLLSKTPDPVRFNQMPNYMNWSSIHGPNRIGSRSNFTPPIQNNLFPANQPSQNVERRSFSEPFVMDNNMDQTSQGFGFGLLGPTYNNFNNDMMSSYGSFASNQPGSSPFSYGIQSFLNNENSSACNPQPHASTQPNHELPQMDNLYSDLDQTNELLYNITNNSGFDQQQQGEDASTNFDLSADFFTEPNQIPPLEDLFDLIFPNTDQGQFYGETSNAFAATETNPPISDMNPSQSHFNGETSNIFSATETNPPTFSVIPDQTNELLYNIANNSGFDQQQQGEDASTNFDLSADFFTELNQIPPLEDLVNLIFPNTDQGQFNGETSNSFAAIETNPPISDMNPSQSHFNGETYNFVSATETNPPTFNVIPDQNQFDEETSNILGNPSIFNMNPNQNQEQDDDVLGFMQWSSLELQELLDELAQ